LDNIDSLIDIEHKNTPSYYGGFYINYVPIRKLNFNLNGYYFGRQEYNHEDYSVTLPYPPFTTTDYIVDTYIDGKFILNLKASYKIARNVTIFINGRNLINSNSSEFGFADKIKRQIWAGFNIAY